MNSLSQLGHQLLAIWKELGLNQRISIVLAAVAVLNALGGVVFWSSRVDYGLLYDKLDDAENEQEQQREHDGKFYQRRTSFIQVFHESFHIRLPALKKHYSSFVVLMESSFFFSLNDS